MDNNPKFIIIVVIVIILLAAGGVGFWFWSQKKAGVSETPAPAAVKDGLGAKALEKTNNPLSGELPETNPFNVNTNPFK